MDPSTETINDHLQIVKLTGGTITITSDPNQIPLSDSIKKSFAAEIQQAQPQSQTLDIADAVAKNGGQPLRLATVKHGQQWYVSLFYSIADNAVHQAKLSNPAAADYIQPIGAGSPEDAVNGLIKQAQDGSLEGVIARLAPDEMAVLHDYGKLLIQQSGTGDLTNQMNDLGVSIDNVTWAVSDVTGGKKVSVQSLSLTADGQSATITRQSDGSVTVALPDQPEVNLNQDSIDSYLTDAVGSADLDQQTLDIIKREFTQVIGLGIVTVQVGDGPDNWYISPVRSFSDVVVSLLKGLQPGDIEHLISLSGN